MSDFDMLRHLAKRRQQAAGVLPQDRPEAQVDGRGFYRDDTSYLAASPDAQMFADRGNFGGGLMSWPFELARGQGRDGSIMDRLRNTAEAFSPIQAALGAAGSFNRQARHLGGDTQYDMMTPEGRQDNMMDVFGVTGMLPMAGVAARRATTGLAERLPARQSLDRAVLEPHIPRLRHETPFERDYSRDHPAVGGRDAGSPLTHTIDNDPIGAPTVAGRRAVDGPDVGLTTAEMARVAQALGYPIKTLTRDDMSRVAGDGVYGYAYTPDNKGPWGWAKSWLADDRHIGVRDDLSTLVRDGVIGHEVGHAIARQSRHGDDWRDGFSARLEGPGDAREGKVGKQLRDLYYRSFAVDGTPSNSDPLSKLAVVSGLMKNYAPLSWGSEATAQGLFAYMKEPGWVKDQFPELAQRAREMVNRDPRLNKVINLNANPDDTTTAGVLAAMTGQAEKPKGIRAYHGSPHDFDRFDMGQIGTGEGAQAYGHGLYFAENEGVARSYRDALGGSRFSDGSLFDDANPAHQASAYISGTKSKNEAIAAIVDDIAMARRQNDEPHAQRLMRAKGMIERGEQIPELNPGRMYEVNINAAPEDFIDWDKPFSQQPAIVNNAIKSLGREDLLDATYPYTARDALEKLGSQLLKPGQSAAQVMNESTSALREAGVPGIRYLDRGSRAAGGGTSNYVVFDDALIDILRKYSNAPDLSTATILGLLSQQQDEPQRR